MNACLHGKDKKKMAPEGEGKEALVETLFYAHNLLDKRRKKI